MQEIRTFVALELPEHIRLEIRKLQNDMAAQGLRIRWVKADNLHLTLKFIGNIEERRIPELSSVLKAVAGQCPAFRLAPKGLGIFPSLRRPRILWVGISEQVDILRRLQRSVDIALSHLGFETESRPYKGHLTIGRFKRNASPKRLADTLRSKHGFTAERFSVEHLVLFKSILSPDGPLYTRIQKLPLDK